MIGARASKSSHSLSGLRGAHKESLASKQPVSLIPMKERRLMMVRDIFPISITTIEDDAFDDLHSLQWLKLWNNDLQTLHYELMEPVLDTLIHLDIHSRTILNHIFSSQCWVSVSQCDIPRKKINQLFLQAILWCVTVRWGGTRGGTMMAGRSVLSYWWALMSFDMLWYVLICFYVQKLIERNLN